MYTSTMNKYPMKRLSSPKTTLPSCCTSKLGLVKKAITLQRALEITRENPEMRKYACLSGLGYHVATKRS
jgi:hypothetical protein